ncbi:efflux transporter outer membrane subunit [Bacteroides sp. 519]|uniref:efflux transporter outer membrane subunit n=1 Tax=Bacteroides sp. 519 TaxID=2302937 RepID=UPI0013D23CB1|nr:efflux transporter outer membrane subunit [Bacteroides sp. 519]NDV60314.1 efflux transporter outer membrane subunit [Bacteroides sp. 519]
MKHIYILLLLIITFVSSCKVGKSYVKPEMDLPDSLMSAQTHLSIADREWWELYTDGPLRNLIEKTLVYNKDLRIAAARVKEMAAQRRISKANLFPQVNANISGDREFENDGGDNSTQSNTFEGKLLLSWELDLWGNLRWAKDAAIADFLQSVEAQRALRMTIVAQVAQAYYELVALDNELVIVRQTLKAREEGVRIARLRFEGGLTSETPYQQACLEVARTATLVPDLERQISLKENEIAFLAGEFPTHVERTQLLQEFNYTMMLPVGMPSDLMERRPDIRQSEQALIAANAQVGVAYTNMFPRLTLTGHYGLESSELSSFLKSPYAFIEGAIVAPIFSAGKNRARWKAQKAAYEQAYYRYEKTVLNAFREVQDAIVEYNKVREMCDLQARLEKSAKSHEELVQVQYINGVINYLDVLDAQRVYFDAQIDLSNSIRDELITVVQIYKALGGGW